MTVIVPKQKNYSLLRGDIPQGMDMRCSSCGSCKCSCTACSSCRCTPCGYTKVKKLVTRS